MGELPVRLVQDLAELAVESVQTLGPVQGNNPDTAVLLFVQE
jgi:hypothetical protein